MIAPPPNLLLVEDDENDVFFMQYALEKTRLNLPLYVARHGDEAIKYLDGVGDFNDRARFPIPDLMFLDLKMPYVHGFQVLEWIRKHPALSGLSVAILTSSPEERDQKRALELGALAYLLKPPTDQELLQLFQTLAPFAALVQKAGNPERAPTTPQNAAVR